MDRPVEDDRGALAKMRQGRLDGEEDAGQVGPHDRLEGVEARLPERRAARHARDGACFGGYVKVANRSEDRIDRRLARSQTCKRKVVVIMRERGGITLPFVFKAEAEAVATIGIKVANGSTIYADEAASWDRLHSRSLTNRINHEEAYSDAS